MQKSAKSLASSVDTQRGLLQCAQHAAAKRLLEPHIGADRPTAALLGPLVTAFLDGRSTQTLEHTRRSCAIAKTKASQTG